jgi:type IV pilus assembly protein PilA
MFLQNLRAKVGARLNGDKESGFTLIELLVVMLILGILAAIALPAFFNQKDKANDAKTKEYAHSAQVAIETYATDHNGSYVGATPALLKAIEPTLNSATFTLADAGGAAESNPSATGYRITVVSSPATQTFSINNAAGVLTYPCTVAGKGGCPTPAEGQPAEWD